MKGYILSIVIAAIICSVLGSILDGNKSAGRIIKMLSGILMVFVLLTPFRDISLASIPNQLEDIADDAKGYVEDGKSSAQYDKGIIIKKRTEAYIVDKAKDMGLDISVEVRLDDDNSIPCEVILTGNLAPFEKSLICDFIEDKLSITKEHQQWN